MGLGLEGCWSYGGSLESLGLEKRFTLVITRGEFEVHDGGCGGLGTMLLRNGECLRTDVLPVHASLFSF